MTLAFVGSNPAIPANYKEVCMQNNIHEKMGKGVKFERIRRITGYLTGSLSTWNNAKKAEERDRVKHSTGGLK